MSSYKNNLSKHAFFEEINQNLNPLIESFAPKLINLSKEGKIRNTDEENLFEQEWYDFMVWKYTNSLILGVSRLEYSQKFLKTFPRPQQYQRLGIYQQNWNEYHYSYYVVTLVSLLDIALILTNAVFRLGNREIDCKPDVIMKNAWVKQTNVQKNLVLLEKTVQPDKHNRNLHVHRGELQRIHSVLNCKEVADLIDLADLVSSVQRTGEQYVDPKTVDKMYRLANKKLISQMQEQTKKLQSVISLLFDDLLPVYREKSTELHNKWDELTTKIKRS